MVKSRKQAGYALLPVVFAGAAVAAVALYLTYSGGLGTATGERRMEAEQLRAVAEAGYSHTVWRSRVLDCAPYTGELATSFENHQYQSEVSPVTGTPFEISVTATHGSGLTRTITRSGVTRYSSTRTTVFQPNNVNGIDTQLSSDFPLANYGSKNTIGPADAIRSLIRFDLSALPDGSTIYSAILTLSPNASSGSVSAYRVTSQWDEGNCPNQSCTPDGATWINRVSLPAPLPWGTPGGDYDPTPLATVSAVPGSPTPTITMDLTALTRDWVNGTVPNQGFIVLSNSPGTQFGVATSDNVDPAQWPKLEITYSCPCGGNCDVVQYCNADYAAGNAGATFPTIAFGGDEIWGIQYLPAGITVLGQTTTGGGGLLLVDFALGNLHLADLDGSPRGFAKAPVPTPRTVTYALTGPWQGSTVINDQTAKRIYQVLPDGTLGADFDYGWHTARVLDLGFIDVTQAGLYDGSIIAVTDVNWKGTQADPRLYLFDYAGNDLKTIDLNQVPPFITTPQGVAHLPGTDKVLVADKQGQVNIYDLNAGAPTILTSYDATGQGVVRIQGTTINAETCEHVFADPDAGALPTPRVRFLDAGP